MIQIPFSSEHFTLHQLKPGVYAAIAIPGGGAYSNAGIIDIGGHTLILDAFDIPIAAQDLLHAVKEYSKNHRISVLLSHHHFDHRGGLQVFSPDVPVISTQKTRELIVESENDPDYNIEKEIEEMREYRISLVEQLESKNDERWQTNLKASLSHLDFYINAIPTIKPRVPDQTFERKITFFGSNTTAILVHAGSGHTLSDSYLYFPTEKVAFIGDLGFFRCHPYILDSDPDGWREILQSLLKLDVDIIIPGHGPPGTKEDLTLLIDYLDNIEEIARQIILDEGSEQDASKQDIPEPFSKWSYGINRFEPNILFFYEKAVSSQEKKSGC